MIKTFADKDAAALWHGRRHRLPPEIITRAKQRLQFLAAATVLDDLRNLSGNYLEKLSGDRAGEYSIRINDQWRLCFRWDGSDAYAVEICDYH
jgi:proteic killer suppression protein